MGVGSGEVEMTRQAAPASCGTGWWELRVGGCGRMENYEESVHGDGALQSGNACTWSWL